MPSVRALRRLACVTPLVACACASSLRPGTLKSIPLSRSPTPSRCEADPPLPALAGRFFPSVEGELALLAVHGDERLSAEGVITVAAWSADSAYLLLADAGTFSLWRGADGSLVDLAACDERVGANAVALSPDLRWLVATGTAEEPGGFHDATCVVDRQTRAARVVPFKLIEQARGVLTFDAAAPSVRGDAGEIELATGVVHRPIQGARARGTPAASESRPARATPDLEGASGSAVSHDGRYLAAWTVEEPRMRRAAGSGAGRSVSVDAPRSALRSERARFVAVWDLETGRRLWKDETHGDVDWQFTANDRLLEGPPTRATHELLRVSDGKVLSFPGSLLPVAPDGQRVLVERGRSAELWGVDPPQPIVAPARPRGVLARSLDGRSVAAYDGLGGVYVYGGLVLQQGGACVAPGVDLGGSEAVEFTPDGRSVYVGTERATGLPTTLEVFATDTGELRSSVAVDDRVPVYPMPGARRVGFGVPHGVQVFDATSGRPLFAYEAPHTTWTEPDAHGVTGTVVADPEGEHSDSFEGVVRASASGRFLVGPTTLSDAPLSVWDLSEPTGTHSLPSDGRVAFTGCGRNISGRAARGGWVLRRARFALVERRNEDSCHDAPLRSCDGGRLLQGRPVAREREP